MPSPQRGQGHRPRPNIVLLPGQARRLGRRHVGDLGRSNLVEPTPGIVDTAEGARVRHRARLLPCLIFLGLLCLVAFGGWHC
jgi:hypothetical protein